MATTGCVYVGQEEVLQTHIAHWWSPDGLRLAYMTINDTLVPSMEVPLFTGTPYPSTSECRYPKASLPGSKTHFISAGEENPAVRLSVVSLNGPLHTVVMKKPDDPRIGREYYITMVKWATSTKLAVNWLNRGQNNSILTLCEATTGVCIKVSAPDGTPGGQMVSEQFRVDWATVLVSSFSTIVVRFDGHGSGFQGTNLLHEVRRQLGKLEEGDQLEALRVAKHYGRVKKTRKIDSAHARYHKAYGGYLATMLLSSFAQLKCGTAVSPITDFELYASAFSERYLGSKTDARVYTTANLAHRAGQLLQKQYLIIHPTADEKVHFQHTAKFINHLISEKANYSLQVRSCDELCTRVRVSFDPVGA
ncbi:Dipeptidyl aminopeptidase-like protein 6 [Liparis tanakae]|uniref:Dipeptidyl aminopeptidase-like protein 6 n=1 Tax=Liparis tanakae TaxID=230148 RepID=A0A4Z2FUE6_9TELE|nr:Dipeptidyl aminopeptidase-like protein 6 [Liparis tanakae]